MNVWKYEVISRVEQDISLIRFAHLSEISWSTLQINFIFPNIHVLFCLLYKKIVLLPHKNRAVNSNAFHDNRHM